MIEIEDVTEATKARPDAHPLKPHDRVLRVGLKGDAFHVKVRMTPHPVSTQTRPVFVLQGSIADETGKAKLGVDGKPAVHETRQELHFIGDDPGYAEDGSAMPEHDPLELLVRGHVAIASRIARAAAAFDRLAQFSAAFPQLVAVDPAPLLLKGPEA